MVVVADSGRMRDRRNRAAARECFESSTARVTCRQLRDRLFHDEDGAGGDRRDLPGDAPQQESLNVAQPAGSDEDEIGLHPPRLSRDRPGEGAMG